MHVHLSTPCAIHFNPRDIERRYKYKYPLAITTMATRRSRFNLLLLEDGEYLLEECTASLLLCKPSGVPDSLDYS